MDQVWSELDVIRVDSLCKTYDRHVSAAGATVKDLSFSVPAGQVCGLVGSNGAGKTTTLGMIAGEIPLSSGTVTLNGYDLVGERGLATKQVAGAVWNGSKVQEQATVWEHTVSAALKSPDEHPEEIIANRVEQFLREVDLWEERDCPLGHLSQGRQSQVATVCALISELPVLLLDEPTQYLDLQEAYRMAALVRRQAHDKGVAVLVSTRDPTVAQALCDRVIVLRRGRMIVDRPIPQLCTLFDGEFYQIQIGNEVDSHRSAWFDGFTLVPRGRNTLLTGMLPDQSALHGLLVKIRDLGLPLLEVKRVYPSPSEVLTFLLHGPAGQSGPGTTNDELC